MRQRAMPADEQHWGKVRTGSGSGASPGVASSGSGAESSGQDEHDTKKKKRRSKPRGGRGHGGRGKKKDPEQGATQSGGPGLLPDPEPGAFARPTIELQLPKHLAHKAGKEAAFRAGGKAPRRPAMATELRVESFNPYARKTPCNTPGSAITPATQLALR